MLKNQYQTATVSAQLFDKVQRRKRHIEQNTRINSPICKSSGAHIPEITKQKFKYEKGSTFTTLCELHRSRVRSNSVPSSLRKNKKKAKLGNQYRVNESASHILINNVHNEHGEYKNFQKTKFIRVKKIPCKFRVEKKMQFSTKLKNVYKKSGGVKIGKKKFKSVNLDFRKPKKLSITKILGRTESQTDIRMSPKAKFENQRELYSKKQKKKIRIFKAKFDSKIVSFFPRKNGSILVAQTHKKNRFDSRIDQRRKELAVLNKPVNLFRKTIMRITKKKPVRVKNISFKTFGSEEKKIRIFGRKVNMPKKF